MIQGEKCVHEKITRNLSYTANWVVRIIGGMIFGVLAWYSMRYTQYIDPSGEEYTINMHDSMIKNIVAVGVVILVMLGLFLAERKLSQKAQNRIMRVVLVIAMAWVALWGLWWITVVDRQPEADQAYVYAGASYFIQGVYSFLGDSGYCGMCPHQLGLMSLMEILFRIVGMNNYFAFQVICVEMTVGIVFLGYYLIRQVTEHMAVAVIHCILMMACLPMIFYTGWVYGDLPSTFFILLTACCLLRYCRNGRVGWLVGMLVSVLLAVLVRQNSIIMVIGLCLTGAIYAFRKADKKLMLALVIAALLPSLSYEAIYKMYEVRSGIEHSDGFPAISYISMGMQEVDGMYGWYTEYCKDVYVSQGFNTELSAQVSKQDILNRLEVFKADPVYTRLFYKEKILSQWNQPLYQCLYFSNKYWDHAVPEPDSFVNKISYDYFDIVLGICDRLQFIIYLGMCCYFIFAVKKDSNILQHMLAVAMLGGFFFCIIWEAKARYSLPYYITMFPCAAIGYWQMIHQVKAIVARFRGDKNNSNIIPFKKVA